MKEVIKDKNGKPSSVRMVGMISFALLVFAALVDIILAVVFVTERNIPDIVYITFSSIVGAAILGASWQHLSK